MKKETIDTLLNKYLNGDSSLSEEAELFEHDKQINDKMNLWMHYAKEQKITVPKNFNDQQWETFESKISTKNKLRYQIVGVAASILLIFSIFLSQKNTMDLSEKQRLLNEAKSMFSDTMISDDIIREENILFENNELVIYTSAE